MKEATRTERVRWIQAAVCIALTYATLGTARTVVNLLRERNLLRVTVAALFVLAAVAVVAAVLRRRPTRGEVLVLVVAGAVYGVLLPQLERAEERLHFLQYGLIGALIYSALDHRWVRTRRRSDGFAGLVAIGIVLVVGWGDEGIQHLLPNRVYDLRDVAFNLTAGALAVGFLIALRRARGEAGTPEQTVE